jgi:hypothetical protein
MIYVFVHKRDFLFNMNENSASHDFINNYACIRFNKDSDVNQHLYEYKRFDKTDYLEIVKAINDGAIVHNKKEKEPLQNYAIANNYTEDGKVLYAKIHGSKAIVPAGDTHEFTYQIEYQEIYFFGAEIMQDIIGVADFTIYHPLYGVDVEQYGFSANLGTLKYIRETRFAARLPQGLVLKCKYTNDTNQDQEVGVNFLMHEIRGI